jgi:hypothetical protein
MIALGLLSLGGSRLYLTTMHILCLEVRMVTARVVMSLTFFRSRTKMNEMRKPCKEQIGKKLHDGAG